MSGASPLDWQSLHVERMGSQIVHCDCCGRPSNSVWGLIFLKDECQAAYFLRWIDDLPEHGADIELIIGQWGKDAGRADRFLVSVQFRINNGQPGFAVVDRGFSVADTSLCDHRLRRNDVIGTPLAAQVFALLDAIYVSTSGEGLRALTV